jgi:hypothetical protein
MSIEVVPEAPPGWPDWIDQTEFTVKDGRDPLGLETITTDRIVPQLVPGILALSGRARYFSLHLFLLDEFQRRRLDPTPQNQSTFFRMREFEFGAAVLLCRHCGSEAAPVGAQSLRGIVRRATDYLDRGFSVDSDYGGYGLYYRSPLGDLGLIRQRGGLVGEEPLPVDIIAGPRAEAIAAAFRGAIADTDYYRTHFMGDHPIPVAALRDFAEAGCLCRLSSFPHEATLVRSIFFDDSPGIPSEAVQRRREAFALRLRLAGDDPMVVTNEARHRTATWSALEAMPPTDKSRWVDTVQRWAALYGKEYFQEGLLILWRELNRIGRQRCPADGLPRRAFLRVFEQETASTVLERAGESLTVKGEDATSSLLESVQRITVSVSLEELRSWSVETVGNSAAALVLLLALFDRVRSTDELAADAAWYQIAREGGNQQPGLVGFAAQMRQHLSSNPTVSETLSWLVRRFILSTHERIATGKLPDFTFRFRMEAGHLRFFSAPGLDFGLADSRHSALATLGRDMDLWTLIDGTPTVTAEGRILIAAAFG